MKKSTLIALGISSFVSIGSCLFLLLGMKMEVLSLVENAGLAIFTGSLFALPSYFVYLSRDNKQIVNQRINILSLLFREVKICVIDFEKGKNGKSLEEKQEVIQRLYYQLLELTKDNILWGKDKENIEKLKKDIFVLCDNINKLNGIISNDIDEEILKGMVDNNLKELLIDVKGYYTNSR